MKRKHRKSQRRLRFSFFEINTKWFQWLRVRVPTSTGFFFRKEHRTKNNKSNGNENRCAWSIENETHWLDGILWVRAPWPSKNRELKIHYPRKKQQTHATVIQRRKFQRKFCWIYLIGSPPPPRPPPAQLSARKRGSEVLSAPTNKDQNDNIEKVHALTVIHGHKRTTKDNVCHNVIRYQH